MFSMHSGLNLQIYNPQIWNLDLELMYVESRLHKLVTPDSASQNCVQILLSLITDPELQFA